MIRIKIRKVVTITGTWLARLECGHFVSHEYGSTERECKECIWKRAPIEDEVRGRSMVSVQSKMGRDLWDIISQKFIGYNSVGNCKYAIADYLVAESEGKNAQHEE